MNDGVFKDINLKKSTDIMNEFSKIFEKTSYLVETLDECEYNSGEREIRRQNTSRSDYSLDAIAKNKAGFWGRGAGNYLGLGSNSNNNCNSNNSNYNSNSSNNRSNRSNKFGKRKLNPLRTKKYQTSFNSYSNYQKAYENQLVNDIENILNPLAKYEGGEEQLEGMLSFIPQLIKSKELSYNKSKKKENEVDKTDNLNMKQKVNFNNNKDIFATTKSNKI